MTGLEDLFKGATGGRPDAFGGAQVFEAIVRRVDGKGTRVTIPAYDRQLLWGPCLPDGAARDTTPSPADAPASALAGGKIRARSARRGTRRVGRDAALGAELALPLGTAAAVLEALVARRATARAGRAPRPRRPLPPA